MQQTPGEDREAAWDAHYRSAGNAPPSHDDWVLEHLESRADLKSVLELGCGTGAISEMLDRAGYDVVATDIAPAALRQLNERAPTW
ncbi:MAG: methyltransferase domain-containing protein [Spirochaetales bacterium]|nr:MAG: methyltransferase domain-containing protein [Spirochaetales bacterium]